ncbi:hypothetical protein D3Y55_21870 [Mesorhizobium sp. DCY119]|nr:hypothetical protein D3Y55_21870 [Mesorhizobium sp. DCY119]
MSEVLERKISITEWSGRVWYGMEDWGKPYFDWRDIDKRHKEPDRLELAIWSDDRLSALALALTTGQAIMLRFLEGDPRQDCPLRGMRIAIALETTANYAQARGKKEIRLQPIEDKLVDLYENVYGFVRESPRNGTAYYRKGV